MADELSSSLEDLNKLAPAARARVSSALKTSVAAELGKTSPVADRGEFSKGVLFSRSRAQMMDDASVVEQASNMDAATFAKFAQNLQTLKGLRSQGG